MSCQSRSLGSTGRRHCVFVIALIFILEFNSYLAKELNCSSDGRVSCTKICNEPTEGLPYSATYCDAKTGYCMCDCRNVLHKDCEKTPFTPCFTDCTVRNPNPDVYLYEGGNCPVKDQKAGSEDRQCACECSVRDDYVETNDI